MISTLLAVLTIDRLGRRVGLYWGAVGQGIALFLLGGVLSHIVAMPSKRERVRCRIDEEVEQFCNDDKSPIALRGR